MVEASGVRARRDQVRRVVVRGIVWCMCVSVGEFEDGEGGMWNSDCCRVGREERGELMIFFLLLLLLGELLDSLNIPYRAVMDGWMD